jgi:hypothetical protein
MLTEFIFMAERELEAAFRFAYIPTKTNVQADIASRHGRICSAPKYILDAYIVRSLLKVTIDLVICSDVAGRVAKFVSHND